MTRVLTPSWEVRDAVIPTWASSWADVIWVGVALVLAVIVLKSCT